MSIRFEDISKSFGDHQVLDHLTFEIATSERVTLIGPSGSGKTTILRMLMGLEQPDSGRILVDDDVLWEPGLGRKPKGRREATAMRRRIGMVFQQFNLFPNMNVLDNVSSPLRYVLRWDADRARERGSELLASVGLADKTEAYPHQLSGGQQQRVAIARALTLEPSIMLFDEVTSALDPELMGEVVNVLKKLAETTTMTMLFVTHQMEFAANISDRVMMFDSGAIVEDRPPAELFGDPREERTKRFLSAVRLSL